MDSTDSRTTTISVASKSLAIQSTTSCYRRGHSTTLCSSSTDTGKLSNRSLCRVIFTIGLILHLAGNNGIPNRTTASIRSPTAVLLIWRPSRTNRNVPRRQPSFTTLVRLLCKSSRRLIRTDMSLESRNYRLRSVSVWRSNGNC